MRKLLVGLFLVGILSLISVPVFAAGNETAEKESDLSSLTELMGDVDLSALHLDEFSTKDVEIDAFLKEVKDSDFLKNLDLSAWNFDAVIKLTEDQELLKSFGIEKVDPAGLKTALEDERVRSLTETMMNSAAEGKSIDVQARALAKNPEVQKLFSGAAGGADLTKVLEGMNSENVPALLNKVAEALQSEKSGEASDLAKSLESLVNTGVTALKK